MEERPHVFDICIICALYEEASAVIDEFAAHCHVSFTQAHYGPDHYEYQFTTIENALGEPLTVLVTWLPEMGPTAMAQELKFLVQQFHPRFVAMTGICAGDQRQVQLGDLIVASVAYHYEEGRITRGPQGQVHHQPAMRMAGPSDQVLQYARGFQGWKKPVAAVNRPVLDPSRQTPARPKRIVAPMASGMAVRADDPFPWLQQRYHRRTIALDMEAASFYQALRSATQALVVKGVSDYADMAKSDAYRDYAARVSAVYVLHFIRKYVTQQTMPRSPQPSPSGVWNVPYRRNPHFTGRDEVLKQLDHQFSPGQGDDPATLSRAALTQPQAIQGLGGIGKTQVAVEYAYRARERGRYTHTLWVNAASEEAIMTSFETLAEALPAFSAHKETDQRKLVSAIKRWLESCPQRWLLVFDNVDDLSFIQEYLPLTGNGSILLTTRSSSVGSLAAPVEVETMSFIEGTQLLLRRAQRFAHASDEEINEAGNIVVALDHFPLALDQAGAYLDETKCSLADYLTLYQSHRKELLARRGEQTTNYPDSVATTWSLSFQRVEQANPAAAELLRLCAFLAPDHIPEELFREGAAYWTPPLQQAATDPFAFNQMLEDLLTFSLVKRLAENHLLSIHRLVQAIQRERMEPEEQHQWAERVVRAVNAVFPRDPGNEITTWPQCLRYLEQAQRCDALIQQHLLTLPEAADLLDRTGTYLCEHALYTLAEPLYQRALALWEQHLGPEHPQVAMTLHNLATLYSRQGKYEEAERLFQRAIRIKKQQLGSRHSQVAISLHNLAALYKEQGKYAEAKLLFQQAIRIKEQQLGPEHPQVALSLNGLAVLHQEQGKYAEAEPLYQRALAIWEQQLGPEHPQMAHPLNNLAALYKEQRKYTEAEMLYRRALHIWEQQLGPEHPQVAYPLSNLALLYKEQGKYAEAESLFVHAQRIWEQQLGPEHPQVAVPLNNLANLYKEQGKYAEAEPLYQRALHIWEQLGPEHLLVGHPLNNLANLYYRQGKYMEAEPLYQRALHIWEQQLGPEHSLVAHPLNGLADLYRAQGKDAEAEPLYQRALSIREHCSEPHHPDLADTFYGFAALREMQGNLKEAASLYQRALAIRTHALGAQHPQTAETSERLRAVLEALSKSEEMALLDRARSETTEGKKEAQMPSTRQNRRL